jgi:hypothetical protein
MSSKTGSNTPKVSIQRVQIANPSSRTKSGKASYRITIPNLGVEWYKRIVHDDGRIELIPVEMLETTVGVANGNDK